MNGEEVGWGWGETETESRTQQPCPLASRLIAQVSRARGHPSTLPGGSWYCERVGGEGLEKKLPARMVKDRPC